MHTHLLGCTLPFATLWGVASLRLLLNWRKASIRGRAHNMIKMDALKVWTTLLSAVAAATVTVLAVLGTAPTASAASAPHGASFSVRCDFSHRASDDPIVHFGHPGASHSHDFFGNRSTNANST